MKLSLQLVDRVATAALRAQVLGPIDTVTETVVEAGLSFRVALVTNLARKHLASRKPGNPFAEPEPELLLPLELPHHRVILNKFPVMEHHLLVITKEYEPQTDALTLRDLQALQALRDGTVDGTQWLFFFNHGLLSGSSQPHKHLQAVPYPIAGASDLDTVLESGPPLPFLYFATPIERDWDAASLHRDYTELVERSRAVAVSNNTLVTPRHVVVVPRLAEDAHGISMNSLTFTFCLLASNAEALDVLRARPLAALQEVCFARDGSDRT